MNHSIDETERKRRELVFAELKNGFTHIFIGRSGFLYYKRGSRLLEIYTEMSGVDEYDFLIWEEGLENWVYPDREPVWEEEKKRISEELVFWLKKQGQKTNFIR